MKLSETEARLSRSGELDRRRFRLLQGAWGSHRSFDTAYVHGGTCFLSVQRSEFEGETRNEHRGCAKVGRSQNEWKSGKDKREWASTVSQA